MGPVGIGTLLVGTLEGPIQAHRTEDLLADVVAIEGAGDVLDDLLLATDITTALPVVVSPGGAYGPNGEGFFRISLTVPDARLAEALERLRGSLSAS